MTKKRHVPDDIKLARENRKHVAAHAEKAIARWPKNQPTRPPRPAPPPEPEPEPEPEQPVDRHQRREERLRQMAASSGTTFVRDGSRVGLAENGEAPAKEHATLKKRQLVFGKKIKAKIAQRVGAILADRKDEPPPTPERKRAARAPRAPGAPKGTLNVPDAAAQVLVDAKGGPLTITEIVDRAAKAGYWLPGGKTPLATMSAAIYSDNKKRGAGARFEKTAQGIKLKGD